MIASLGFLVVAWLVFGTTAPPPVPAGATRESALHGILGNFWWLAFLATFFGIVLTQVIGKITEYFTAAELKPVTEIASFGPHRPGDADPGRPVRRAGIVRVGHLSIAATIYGAYMLFPDPAFAAYAHRAGRPGPAGHHRLRAGDGHLRPDHRQRQRHL